MLQRSSITYVTLNCLLTVSHSKRRMFAAQVYVDGRIADLESFSMKDAPRELQVYISKSPNVRTCHIRTI